MRTFLGVFAHPDDETFGPGGTLALWAKQGDQVHVLSMTKGEAGTMSVKGDPAHVRVLELNKAADILGATSVEVLDFPDGMLSNNDLPKLEEAITLRIQKLKPNIVVTFDLNGISGHLDHIAVASAATQAFKKTGTVESLYYYTVLEGFVPDDEAYFILRPPGRTREEISMEMDITPVWDTKVAAMRAHKSQAHDIERILARWKNQPKRECFIRLRRKPWT